jgi:O-antigen ligase
LVIPSTDLANPNDLGLALLFMISSLLVPKSFVSRIFTTLALPVFVYEILKTGSRACLVTLLVLVGFVFVLVSTRTKVIMAVLVPIAMVVISVVVPSFTLTRLTLFVDDPGKVYIADDQLRGAAYSQMARTDLQRRAIELTIHHPLLGVGAGMFEDAVEGMVRMTTGQKSGWQGAHNTYLEIAAENGIPAFIFYTWCILLCLKMNYRAYKMCRGRPELSDMATQSLALLLVTLAFAVCTFFSNNAYDAHSCVLIGLTAASSLALKRELPVEQIA